MQNDQKELLKYTTSSVLVIWASFAVAEFVVMIVSFVLYFRRLKTDHLISDKQLNQNNI